MKTKANPGTQEDFIMMMVILHYPAVAPTLAEVTRGQGEIRSLLRERSARPHRQDLGHERGGGPHGFGLSLRGQGHRRRLVQFRETAQLPPGEQREPRVLRRRRYRVYETPARRGDGVVSYWRGLWSSEFCVAVLDGRCRGRQICVPRREPPCGVVNPPAYAFISCRFSVGTTPRGNCPFCR